MAVRLSTALASLDTCSSIDLGDAGEAIGAGGCEALALQLASNNHVTSLNLGSNQIGDLGCQVCMCLPV